MSLVYQNRLERLEQDVQGYRLLAEEDKRWKAAIECWLKLTFGYDIRTVLGSQSQFQELNDSPSPPKRKRPSRDKDDSHSHSTIIQNCTSANGSVPSSIQVPGPRHHHNVHSKRDDVHVSNCESQPNAVSSNASLTPFVGNEIFQTPSSFANENERYGVFSNENVSVQQSHVTLKSGSSTPKPKRGSKKGGNGKGKARGKKFNAADNQPFRDLLSPLSPAPRRKLKNLTIDEKYEVLQRLLQPGVNQATVCEERQLNKSVVSRIWCDRFKIQELYRDGRGKHIKVKKVRDDEPPPTLVPLKSHSDFLPQTTLKFQQPFQSFSRYNLLCLYTRETFRELQRFESHAAAISFH